MTVTRGRTKAGYFLTPLIVLSAPLLLTDCGKMPGKGLGGIPGAGGACPADIADASALMEANFGLEGELEGKVKGALGDKI